MKNKLSFFLLIFCFAFQAQAQLSIGLKGGYTRAWQNYGDVSLPPDAPIEVNGANTAILAWYRVNKRWSFGVEPGMIRRGAACIPGFIVFEGDTRFLLDYLELPGMFRFDILSLADHKFQIYTKLGAGVSMILRAQEEVVVFEGAEPFPRSERTPIDLESGSILNRWDIGGYGTIGASFNFGNNQILLEGNYYYGLIDASRSFHSQNRSFNISAGLMHNF